MSKHLVERVLDRLKEHSKKSYSHNRAIFLSLSDEIREALGAGLSLKAIWETLYEEGRISFKYDTFLRYSRQCFADLKKIKPNSIKNSVIKTTRRKTESTQNDVLTNREKSSSSKITTFEFNPTDDPEDLI